MNVEARREAMEGKSPGHTTEALDEAVDAN
jgi:hypothetical protein